MDKYRELISIFSEILEKSKDYHIAYIYQVGYVSLIGLLSKEEQNASMIVDEVFSSPESMAESLLRNWRWQWFYENKELLPRKTMTISANSTAICRTTCRSSTDRVFRTGRAKFRTSCESRVKAACRSGVR